MEPQLEGCGKSAAVVALSLVQGASMEPQLEGCGKQHRADVQQRLAELQWSRNLRVAESAGPVKGKKVWRRLQWSRNLRVAESRAVPPLAAFRLGASMEPQLEGCGKAQTDFFELEGVDGLQWSRNLRVAES